MQQQPLTSAAQTPIDLSVRVIPFAVGGDGLEVGLLWNTLQSRTIYLPTGCPRHAESLTDCANRVAIDALATTPDYLEQLYTFSVNGSPLEVIVAYSAILSADTRARVPSYADVRFEHADDRTELSDVDRGILDYAKMRLRAKLGYSNIGFFFVPEEFTLSELQDVYESVIGRDLDKRNFRRRVLADGIIEPVGAKRPTSHRPATLYRFTGGNPAHDALTPGDTDWRF